jgi:hypothetical protein
LIVLQPRTVKFIDRCFNFCKAQASWIWEYIITADCTCDFHFEIYPDLLLRPIIDLLAKALREDPAGGGVQPPMT